MTVWEKASRQCLSTDLAVCAAAIDEILNGKAPLNLSMGLLSRLLAIKEALIEVSKELCE